MIIPASFPGTKLQYEYANLIDFPKGCLFKNIDDISINKFTDKDVVRHKLVQDIIKAYEKYHEKGSTNNGKGKSTHI